MPVSGNQILWQKKNKKANTQVTPSNITVIGAGAIGLSWTALFLANGWKVTINDPREDIKTAVQEGIELMKPKSRRPGLFVSDLFKGLSFEADLEKSR